MISFSRTDEKHTREYITHLVQSAYYDTERDIVQLQADPRLFELYQFDRKVLLQLKAINALKRRESAQALYTFIESLPRDPAPISLARLRARLNLKSPVFSQNQTVRRAMEQLREIGYLDYTEIQRGRTKFFCIHYRRPRLKAPNDEVRKIRCNLHLRKKSVRRWRRSLPCLRNWASRWMTWKNSSNPAEHKL